MDFRRGDPTVSSNCSRSRPPLIWAGLGVCVGVAADFTKVVAVVVVLSGVFTLLAEAVDVISDGDVVLVVDFCDVVGAVVAIVVGAGMIMTAEASIG